jgi:hypothetical protein
MYNAVRKGLVGVNCVKFTGCGAIRTIYRPIIHQAAFLVPHVVVTFRRTAVSWHSKGGTGHLA